MNQVDARYSQICIESGYKLKDFENMKNEWTQITEESKQLKLELSHKNTELQSYYDADSQAKLLDKDLEHIEILKKREIEI